MFLKNLKLANFRNFEKLNLDFAPVTLIVGNNAQGKSNLLEAIYFLSTTKSTRVEKDLQLIKLGEKFCRIEGEVCENAESDKDHIKMEVGMQRVDDEINNFEGLEKRVKINGLPKRVFDYIGNLVVIYFSPEDINLVSGSPALRRLHLDLTLSSVDKSYKKAHSEYSNILTSRNRVLKRIREGLANLAELEFWSSKAVELGTIISEKRSYFFQYLNETGMILNQAVGSFGEVKFIYRQSLITKERVSEYLEREIASSTSLIGPHRDDFSFELNGGNLAYFGSRGQQRMAVLDLKLIELEFINQTKKITPLLLLDDIFSELDQERRAYVVSVIHGYQTVLSTVDTDNMPKKFLDSVLRINIKKGKVS